MAELKTKYSVGDVVYCDRPCQSKRRHDCPDCLGEKSWKTTSPAGTDYQFDCPRCTARYRSDARLNLDYTWFEPNSTPLTIGEVRVESSGNSQKVDYMAHETGIGSGTLYREENLHATVEEALAASQILADENNNNPDMFVLPQYKASLEVCDYQLKQIPKSKKKK